MRKWRMAFLLTIFTMATLQQLKAQCSICSKTSAQQGEKAGKGMNGGIVYLMLMPLTIIGVVGYRWWRQEKDL